MAATTAQERSSTRGGRRVAVTGAGGFYGRQLLSRLTGDARYERVLTLDVREPEVRHPKVAFRSLDLTRPTADQELLAHLAAHEIDTLVHLALLVEPSHHSAWAHELEAIGTLHVLNACAEHGIEKVVVQSSTIVYGPSAKNPNFLTESHPLGGLPASRYVTDRVEIERQLLRFKRENPEVVCTSLRFAPVVGPSMRNWVTRYLGFPTPLCVLGFDPMVQFLHETDAVDALSLAVSRDFDGAWNIVGDGVLPLSVALRSCGRVPMPLPGSLARAWVSTLWLMQLVNTPPTFVDFLQYLCVADSRKARERMGFVPRYTSREALLAFAGSRRLGDSVSPEAA